MIQIQISTQPIRMEYSTQKPLLSLQSTSAKLAMSTEAASLEIEQPHGELSIDQSPLRASCGMKDFTTFMLDYAAAGRSAALEAAGKLVEDGNRMLHIETKEDVVVALATERNNPPPGELIWGHLAGPDIQFTARPPQISYHPGSLQMDYQPSTFRNDSQRGSLDIRVTQYPSIQFSTTGSAVDMGA